MTTGPEYTLVEKPCIDTLVNLGYVWLPPQQHDSDSDSQNQVILRDVFITAIQRINAIPLEAARAAYQDMLAVTDNETWLSYLRGNYSRNVPGESTKKQSRLLIFSIPKTTPLPLPISSTSNLRSRVFPISLSFSTAFPLSSSKPKSPLLTKIGSAK